MPVVPGTAVIRVLWLCSLFSKVSLGGPPLDSIWQLLLMDEKESSVKLFVYVNMH